MMKPNELRIGNYIYGADNSHVIAVDVPKLALLATQLNLAMPIPLTPEILDKSGFEHEAKEGRINGINTFHVYTKNDFTFNSNHGWWYNGKQLKSQPKHLHQLQNIYFALTGEELEIKL